MIVKEPAPILHSKCRDFNWKQARQLGKSLHQEYAAYQAEHPDFRVVGLAAPQIGIRQRAFLAFGETFINPIITLRSDETINVREGCCSLGDEDFRMVKRHAWVTLAWFDGARKMHKQTFENSMGAIVQHEVDHLNGVLISDRAPLPKVQQADKKAKAQSKDRLPV